MGQVPGPEGAFSHLSELFPFDSAVSWCLPVSAVALRGVYSDKPHRLALLL